MTTPRRSSSPAARAHHRGPFATDLDKYYATVLGGNRSLAARMRLWLFHSDFHCVASFRFGQAARDLYSRNKIIGILPLVISLLWRRRLATIHHVNIDRHARIGPGFYVMHRNGLFVGPVTIGEDCVLHHNVTIGQRVSAGDQGVPTLGDHVWVGPGSTIFGEITIGNNVTISAGTVISKSVPDGSLVAGNPGRVIRRDYDNSSMIGFVVPTLQDDPRGAAGAARVPHLGPLAGPDPVNDHEAGPHDS